MVKEIMKVEFCIFSRDIDFNELSNILGVWYDSFCRIGGTELMIQKMDVSQMKIFGVRDLK